MKRTITCILASIVLIAIIFISLFNVIGKQTDVFLAEYALEGEEMTLHVGVASSIGFVRTLKVKTEGERKLITFYSTYGLNNRIGARDEFKINIEPTCNEIYFYRGGDKYALVLKKDEQSNEWQRVLQK